MALTHVYAIIPAREAVSFDAEGVDRAPVWTVAWNEHAVVLGGAPLADYRGLDRQQAIQYLLAHQRVVETVMRGYPVLPVKFGTLLPSDERARDLIAQGEPLFRKALSALEGRTQVEVVVLWDTGEIFKELAADERVREMKGRVESSPADDTAEARMALGRLVYDLMEERRAGIRDSLVPELSAGAADAIVHACLDDGMILNLALLVDREGRECLNRLLDDLDRRFESRFNFRLIGPLPPYSFASVEVKAPTFDEVDWARRLLGLAQSAAKEEIRQAYHRLAAQSHPDLDPSNPEAESRMSQLADACAFLTEYAQSACTSAESPALFDEQTVERTLMISISRQESAAWSEVQSRKSKVRSRR
jgi:hypothetical protein